MAIIDVSSDPPLTLLGIVRRFFDITNIGDTPNAVIGTTDQQVKQVRAILETEGNTLSGRGMWTQQIFEATHTTVATESQGNLSTICDNPRYILSDTAWDRTENLPLQVIDARGWQAEQGFAATSPRYSIRLRGKELISTPTPVAGNTWAFEYVTWNWILDDDGSTYKQYFTDDQDTFLLPEPILLQGLRWRWKKEKGFDYAEDFQTYEFMVKEELGRQRVPKVIRMDTTVRESVPGVVVPQGSWAL